MSPCDRSAAPTSRWRVLTLLWGTNWIAMKQALTSAHPIVFNIERTWAAIAVLFAVLVVRRRPLLPESWAAVAVTGFFQTTVNMGSTTMALADGGAGRAAVLVFTMPFWTVLLAWPVLGERVRGIQWIAIALALAGLTLVVEPWHWDGELKPKAWAVLSGFGWACGTIAMKYFQRARSFDMLNFIAWQMLLGILPLSPPSARAAVAGDAMERGLRRIAAVDRRARFRVRVRAVGRRAALSLCGNRIAQHAGHPGHRAPFVDGDLRRAPVDERMDRHRLHRRRSLRHLVSRLAREPPRRAVASEPIPPEGG